MSSNKSKTPLVDKYLAMAREDREPKTKSDPMDLSLSQFFKPVKVERDNRQ